MGALGGSLPNLQPGVSGFIRRPLGPRESMLLCGLGLVIPGQVGYDGKHGRTWIVGSGWVLGVIDDGGTGKLTLSAA